MVGAGACVFALMGYVISKQQPPDFTVELNSKLLAAILGETEDEIEKAVEYLCAPDPISRSPDNEGRRLLKVGAFNYHVVNGAAYNRIRNYEERKAYNREAQAKYRSRNKPSEPEVRPPTPIAENQVSSDAVKIIQHLNGLTGSKFRASGDSLVALLSRMAEPDVTVDGIMAMITRQSKLWKDDPKMVTFLRPSTLFRPSKFNEYYAARELPASNSNCPVIKPNPRNIGVAKAGPSYGDMARAKLERQNLVSQVAQVGNQQPAGA